MELRLNTTGLVTIDRSFDCYGIFSKFTSVFMLVNPLIRESAHLNLLFSSLDKPRNRCLQTDSCTLRRSEPLHFLFCEFSYAQPLSRLCRCLQNKKMNAIKSSSATLPAGRPAIPPASFHRPGSLYRNVHFMQQALEPLQTSNSDRIDCPIPPRTSTNCETRAPGESHH